MAAGLSARYCVVPRVSETLAMETSLAGSVKNAQVQSHYPLHSNICPEESVIFRLGLFSWQT